LADLEHRSQRVWSLAEDGMVSANQLSARLAELDVQRVRAQSTLEEAVQAVERAASISETRTTLAEVFEQLADLWVGADVEDQQGIARAIGELPEIGGLNAFPERRGELFPGGAMLRETDDLRSLVTVAAALQSLAALRGAGRPRRP
jgi:hypothetical protein